MSYVNDFASTDNENDDKFVLEGGQLNAVDDETKLEASETSNDMNMCEDDDLATKKKLSEFNQNERKKKDGEEVSMGSSASTDSKKS